MALAEIKIRGPRATITLNRPAKHNVIEAADLPGISLLLDQVEANTELRVLVITGTGDKTFSAGYDIGDIESTDWQENPLEVVVDRLEQLALPTVCALNGSVYGGATDLALACDFRIGIEGMRLRVPAAQLGVSYYINGLKRFVERVGPAAARRIFLLGEEIGGAELLTCGYLNRLAAREDLGAATDEIANRLTLAAPLAVRSMKRAINDISRGCLDETAARDAVIACFASDDVREGARAFAERRPALFTGR
ncbi:MAG: enoyl-CoA hydratase-related protein [Proteobacteria bacterium]|nr:enoyl-CoA hydratase-related protein [Pseudomonadota bacterium]